MAALFSLRTVTRTLINRAPLIARPVVGARFSSTESPADFDAKWVEFFSDSSLTSGEVRRGLNDVFAHDLIPDPKILEAALRATRRVNDFPTSVRIFEGVKDKSPDDATYQYVIGELSTVISELELSTPEELGFQ